ncbi:MAG: tandem-95 repeat protein, partial [Candidatus Accumulibacter meliphilus]
YQRVFTIDLPGDRVFEGGRNDTLINATALPLAEDPAGSGLLLGRGMGRQDPAVNYNSWSDADYWRVELQAGDLVSVSVDTPDSDVNAVVELRNAADGALATSDNEGPGSDAFISRLAVTASGSYYVVVGKEYYSQVSGAYELGVQVARGIDQESDANYSNNSIGGANILNLVTQGAYRRTAAAGSIMAAGDGQVDADTYSLGPIDAGNTVLLGIRLPYQSALRPIVEIYTANNALVSIAPNPSSGVARFDVKTPGTYYARVLAFSGEGPRGQYLLDAAIWPTAELQFADLAVSSVLAPAAAQSGETIHFEWTVGNFGTAAPTVPSWDDEIVLSVNDRVGDGDDLLLASISHTGELLPGEQYTAQADIRLPLLLSGTYQLLVKTDHRNAVYENLFETNNVGEGASLITVSQTAFADLQASAITVPVRGVAGESLAVEWTVDNVGLSATGNGTPGATVSAWVDRLVLSQNTVFGDGDDRLWADVTHDGVLAVGGSYTGTLNAALPAGLSGTYYVFVASDHANSVYEGPNAAPNALHSAATVTVAPAPYADLAVTTVTAPQSVVVGQPFQLQWTVANTELAWGATPVADWTDRVLLSSDDVIGNSDDIVLTSFAHHGTLARGESYSSSETVAVPPGNHGAYQLFVITDAANSVFEFSHEGNNAAAGRSLNVLSPNLTIADVMAPAAARLGDAIEVSWITANSGDADVSGNWLDRVWLSTDQVLGNGDLLLATLAGPAAGLGQGQHAQGVATITLPLGDVPLPGAYFLLVQSDATSAIAESNESDNSAVSAVIDLSRPPLPNLQVRDVAGPATALPGRPIQLSWTTFNDGNVSALGGWSEQVWLTADDQPGADTLLASFFYSTNEIAPSVGAVRSESVTLPTTAASGAFKLVVRADSGARVLEQSETDNAGVSVTDLAVGAALNLSLSAAVVAESAGSGAVRGTVTRSGSTAEALTVLLDADPSQLVLPASITIAAGSSAASFQIGVRDNQRVDGERALAIRATAGSELVASETALRVVDDDRPALSLITALASVDEGFGPVTVTVTRNTDPTNALTVNLSTDSPSTLSTVSQVLIAAGEASASFAVTPVDDVVVLGNRTARLSANGVGHAPGGAQIEIVENDVPSITLSLSSAVVSEAAGFGAVTLTVARSGNLGAALGVVLNTDSPQLRLSKRVTFSVGQSTVEVPVTVLDNSQADGSRVARIIARVADGVLGTPLLGTGSEVVLQILDDDGPALSLAMDRTTITEGATALATLRRNTGTESELTVTLASSVTGELDVPTAVVIPAGKGETTFAVTGVVDGQADGTRDVTLTASAPGLGAGAASLRVTDRDLADLRPTSLVVPGTARSEETISIEWVLRNEGIGAAGEAWVDQIFLSDDPVLDDGDALVATVAGAALNAGESYSHQAEVNIGSRTGDIYLFIRADAQSTQAEAVEHNNALQAHLAVRPAYRAAVRADVDFVSAGNVVPLLGRAFDPETDAPVTGVQVSVKVKAVGSGIVRTINATTDASGNFSTQFTPMPGEMGRYEVAADHPAMRDAEAQDSFSILGLTASSDVRLTVIPNQPASTDIEILNAGGLSLTGLTASVIGAPDFIAFELSLPSTTLEVGQAMSLALSASVTVDQPMSGRVVVRVMSQEGVVLEVPVEVSVAPLTASLVAYPGTLQSGMLRGRQTLVGFELANAGGVATGPVSLQLPDAPWLQAASSTTIASLAPGERTFINLLLDPAADLPLGRYTGEIVLSGSNQALTLPFQFNAVSDAVGELLIRTEDEYTFFAEDKPPLADVRIVLADPDSGEVIATALTGADGSALFSELPEGNYLLTALADGHAAVNTSVTVGAGSVTEQSLFLSRQAANYRWTVVPIEQTDRYRLVLEADFEANVPMPVVVVDQPYVIAVVAPGEVSQIYVTVRNLGLIDALDVRVVVPDDPDFLITPLIDVIPVLPARGEVSIPIAISLRNGATAVQSLGVGEQDLLLPQGDVCDFLSKCLQIDLEYTYECNLPVIGTVPVNIGFLCDSADTLLEMAKFLKAAAGIKDGIETLIEKSVVSGSVEYSEMLETYSEYFVEVIETDDYMYVVEQLNSAQRLSQQLAVDLTIERPLVFRKLLKELLDDVDSLANKGKALTEDFPGSSGRDEESACANLVRKAMVAGVTPAVIAFVGGGPGAAIAAGATAVLSELTWKGLLCLCERPLPTFEPSPLGDISLDWWKHLGKVLGDGPNEPPPVLEPVPPSPPPTPLCKPVDKSPESNALSASADDAEVCATVRLQLQQEAVFTRTAFLASLEFENATGNPIQGLSIELDIRDQLGNLANKLFGILAPDAVGLIADDDGWRVEADSSGALLYTLIAAVDAAVVEPTRYAVGGTLRYLEGGVLIEVPLLPSRITVYPEAQLELNYFWQRDVVGDDPFTEPVEDSEPFVLGLQVTNVGYGSARGMAITSGQPEIVDNEKGLLIDFKIVDAKVQDQAAAPSLSLTLGGLAPGGTTTAQWNLISSLQGKFDNYDARFEQMDSFGNIRASLIKSVDVHELIRAVQVDVPTSDGIVDFLVNDLPDAGSLPDALYLSSGGKAAVTVATGADLAGAGLERTLTATMAAGWSYLKLPDVLPGYELVSVVRSDGKHLAVDSGAGGMVWRTDRSFPAGHPGAVYENLVHLLDVDSTGIYTLTYGVVDGQSPELLRLDGLPLGGIAGLQNSAIDVVELEFSEPIDGATLAADDFTLLRNGTPIALSALVFTPLAGTVWRVSGLASATAQDGNYRLSFDSSGILDLAGNPGVNTQVLEWALGASAPVIVSMQSVGDLRTSAVGSLEVRFSQAMDIASLGLTGLELERDGQSVQLFGEVIFTPVDAQTFRIEGLAAYTQAQGTYTLTVHADEMRDASGRLGAGQLARSWRMDTTAPQPLMVESVATSPRNTVVRSLDVDFSEGIDPSSFDWRDIKLTRNFGGAESANLITSEVVVEQVDADTFRVKDFNWKVGLDGVYTLTVHGEGLRDLAENSGAGAASSSWVMDIVRPLAVSDLHIGPDNGVSDADQVTDTLSLVVSGTVPEEGMRVRLTDMTRRSELAVAQSQGGSFDANILLDGPGAHSIRVRTSDAAGNISPDVFVEVFVDLTAPSVLGIDAIEPSPRTTPVESVDVRADETVFGFDLADITLSHDGQILTLDDRVMVSADTANTWRISGLSSFTLAPGFYQLEVSAEGFIDRAGNAGVGSRTVSWSTLGGLPTAIKGFIYEDLDASGTFNPASYNPETAIAGRTVFLDDNGNGLLDAAELSTSSAADGSYAFDDLLAGDYRVAQLLPAGWILTTPGAGAHSVTLVDGQTVTGRNFGNFQSGVIEGVKFNDLDADGTRDADEPVLAGWTIFLDANANEFLDDGEASIVTDAEGVFRFTDIGPGTVQVGEVMQSGWQRTTPDLPYHVKSGFTVTSDVGNVMLASITGAKYNDLDGNGARDAGEPGIEGWTIFLDSNGNGVLDGNETSTLTDADGNYRFSGLLPALYTVAEVQRDGWTQTSPLPGPVGVAISTAASSIGLESLSCGCGATWATYTGPSTLDYGALAINSALDTVGISDLRALPEYADLDGRGVTTVLIDTGIDLNHSFFGPDRNGDRIDDRIVFQYDFANGDGDASDVNGHGSHIASLIGSQDAQYPGVAPGTDLIVLKVFEDSGRGYFSYLEQALQWVLDNHEAYQVGVVNLSLGDGGNWTDNFSRYGIGDELAALAQTDVIVVAAAGNNYLQFGRMGLAYPASDPAAIAVGATWAADFGGPWTVSTGATSYSTGVDRIAAFSQRDTQLLDTFAPGARFNGADASGGIRTMQGTSQAAAFVSGSAALAQQIARQTLGRGLTTGEFATLLRETGTLINDGDDEVDNVANTDRDFARMDFLQLALRIAGLGSVAVGETGVDGEGGGDAGVVQQAASAVHSVRLTAGASVTGYDFGNFERVSLTGQVFADSEGNGILDGSDSGLQGWTVFIDTDLNGRLDAGESSVPTSSSGSYSFVDLGPGTYRVAVETLPEYQLTTAHFFDLATHSGEDSNGGDFGANQTPTARDDSFDGNEDQIISGSVAANDSDADGPAYSAQLVTAPAHGTLTLAADGSFDFTPDADWNGSTSFSYQVLDGINTSAVATVKLSLAAVNDVPLAADDAFTLNEDELLVVAAAGVVDNDTDIDSPTLTATVVAGPQHGSLTLNEDGSFSYKPTLNFNGSDSFSYRANDGQVDGNVAVVTLNVLPVNDRPLAEDDNVTTPGGTPIVLKLAANDSDVDGDSLSVSGVGTAQHGTVVLNSDGSVTYTSFANYFGDDSFDYTVSDPSGAQDTATVTVSVSAVNGAPTGVADNFTGNEDQPITGNVLDNDSDVDGQELSAILVSGPANGSLQLEADGSFSYTPKRDFNGVDSFSYRANDGQFDSDVATVSLRVSPVNDPPKLAEIADVTLAEGQTLSLGVAGSDIDAGDTLSYAFTLAPAGASIDPDSGAITWLATDGDSAGSSVDFGVSVSDADGETAKRSFTVNVLNVAPTLSAAGLEASYVGQDFVLELSSSDPGSDTISEWRIDWGDGQIVDYSGSPGRISHVYSSVLGEVLIRATASDEDGSYLLQPLQVVVLPLPLQVESLSYDSNGFAVRFNDAFNAGVINLYDSSLVGLGAADLVLTGSSGLVKGSLVFDADYRGLRYQVSGNGLAAGNYSLTLKSGAQAFHSIWSALDGDADGLAGDDCRRSFTVAAAPALKLSLPDFMRGPGQSVNVPAAGSKLPLTLFSSGNVRQLSFVVRYDPTLLLISSSAAGVALPADATLDFSGSLPGELRVHLSSLTAIAAGTVTLLDLVASVPTTAPYGAAQILDIDAVSVNGQALNGADDDALQVVGYLGDGDANGRVDRRDVMLIQRNAANADSGFAAWSVVDPRLLADVDLDGRITGRDIVRIGQEMNRYDSALIPNLPTTVPLTFTPAQAWPAPASSGQTLPQIDFG